MIGQEKMRASLMMFSCRLLVFFFCVHTNYDIIALSKTPDSLNYNEDFVNDAISFPTKHYKITLLLDSPVQICFGALSAASRSCTAKTC